jgi:hypothetical protein
MDCRLYSAGICGARAFPGVIAATESKKEPMPVQIVDDTAAKLMSYDLHPHGRHPKSTP